MRCFKVAAINRESSAEVVATVATETDQVITIACYFMNNFAKEGSRAHGNIAAAGIAAKKHN